MDSLLGVGSMKKLLILCVLFLTVSVSPVFALTLSVYDSGDTSSINSWINGGKVTVLEDFEGIAVTDTMNWYKSLATGVGEFTAKGSAKGTGDTSYNANNSKYSKDAYFSIQDRSDSWYGRYNTTDATGASQWLDSGDINKLTLSAIPTSLTNLFFYMQDPSDVGAVTTIGANVNMTGYDFKGKSNGASYFVGITLDKGESLSRITWSTTTVGDGYGLDDFSTVAPVPEPATMLLFGAGLVGLAGFARRKKK